ncbi:protein of unknown function [Cyclobacterium xiamenense]|uniref:DUF4271 domain-containing protein n=1 Tax=Cyclobacterium xiamenense TaxID=1297121 RepID=A0A1H6Y2Z7_9BACT|nr:DUF4271 domain-containing protein [Cyclobacterium xiamenense]SEJ31522.1 protein of unknown function [Cyclobacterium xiamenense]
MKRNYRLFLGALALFFGIFFAETGRAQVLINYDPEIQEQEGGWLAGTESMHVWVDTKQFAAASWRIVVPRGAGLFIGDNLWILPEKDTLVFLSNETLLSQAGAEGKVKLTARKKGIEQDDFSVKKGFFVSDLSEAVTQAGAISTRQTDRVKDFFFLAVLVLLFFIALFRLLFPTIFGVFWNPAGIFSFEDLWESVGFSKVYSAELLFYLIVVNLGVGLMALFGMHLFGVELTVLAFDQDVETMVLLWLVISLVATLLTFFKFMWLAINTFIFDLERVALPHFFYLLKVSGFGLLVVLAVTVVLYANELIPDGIYLEALYYSFFGLYTLGIIGLTIWLYKKNGFNNYHLFSYLCTSELIPFLVICKLLLG